MDGPARVNLGWVGLNTNVFQGKLFRLFLKLLSAYKIYLS